MMDFSDDDDFTAEQLRRVLDSVPAAAVKQSWDLLLNFGYCPNHHEAMTLALKRAGIKLDRVLIALAGELYELAQTNREFTHHLLTVNGDSIRQACLQVNVLHLALQNARKSGVVISSKHYARSFSSLPLWLPAYDNLIVQLALTYGLRDFTSQLKNYKPVKEWALCAFHERVQSENHDQQLSLFCRERLRFIIYCVVMTLRETT